MRENITQKNSFEMKFCSTLLLTEGKMTKEKRDICPESLSRSVVVSPVIYMQNLNNTHFSSPWLSIFIPITYKIGAHPISPPYSFHFITIIIFLILSNLERYKNNCSFSCDRYSSKLFQSGNACQRIKKYPAQN